MTSKTATQRRSTKSPAVESLYADFIRLFYDERDLKGARKIAPALETILADRPDIAASTRGEEVRSLLAELKGDLVEAIRSREAEIRKILELHVLAMKNGSWNYVARQYDHADVSDRLDLLAILYDRAGDQPRAKATLLESRNYCQSYNIPFDGQEILDELQASTPSQRRGISKSPAKAKVSRRTAVARRDA